MATDFFDDKGGETSKRTKSNSNTPVLDNFSSDLTQLDREGKIDDVVGRDEEIKRMVQILSRKKKRNVIVVGEPGVGKSALAEKLARIINRGNCPHELVNKRVVALDLTSIVAGTKYRGQFEERMKSVINEVKAAKNVILFIDEIHTMMGAGNSSGNMDAANILKPALARGEIQLIGATTLDEYKKHLEKDGALERRFGKIILKETTKDETVEILTRIKKIYEEYHNVIYSDEVIKQIVDLTDQYITDRFFPDKAIDILDDLGAEKKTTTKVVPKEVEDLKLKLEKIRIQKAEVVRKQDYETAAEIKKDENIHIEKLTIANEKWKKDLNENKIEVNVEDVYNLMTTVTGIPINKTDDIEVEKLINFEKLLSESVIGQKEAITTISKAIRRNRVGVKDKNRPQFSGMFLGESGTGKTHLTKMLAQLMFGDPTKIIRIDMSEYMDKHNVSKLIGSPPGFVGYEEGGQLTEKVKNNPFSIILFDEIEKAHKDVFNLLLQVLDEGHLTDSFGRKINFKNTVIIMTSNVGAKTASEFGGGLGFGSSMNEAENKKQIIRKELKKTFAPEFLNRIDDIVIFDRLNDDEIKQIIGLEIKGLEKRMLESNYKVTFDGTVIDQISTQNREEGYGARPIKRIIQNLCEDFIADQILMGKITENTPIFIKFKEKLIISKRK